MYNFKASHSKNDISDMRKTSILHGEWLIFSGLWQSCNECNGILKVNYFCISLSILSSMSFLYLSFNESERNELSISSAHLY